MALSNNSITWPALKSTSDQQYIFLSPTAADWCFEIGSTTHAVKCCQCTLTHMYCVWSNHSSIVATGAQTWDHSSRQPMVFRRPLTMAPGDLVRKSMRLQCCLSHLPSCLFSLRVKMVDEPSLRLCYFGGRWGVDFHRLPWQSAPLLSWRASCTGSFSVIFPKLFVRYKFAVAATQIIFNLGRRRHQHLYLTTGYDWLSHNGYCFPNSSTWICFCYVYQSGSCRKQMDCASGIIAES